MASAPIKVQEVLALPSLGINQQYMAFPTVTMESDKFVCVRETGDPKQLTIVDMATPMQPQRRPMQADSVIMHPNRKIIAVRAFQNEVDTLQVFNLETKAKLKAHALNEQVVLWKWVDETTIGLVTATTVYHWSTEGDSAPQRMFARSQNLAQCQIISYKVSPDGKWCVVVGIAPGSAERPQLVRGQMQLWSIEQSREQNLEAHAATFAQCKLPGRDRATQCIAIAQKTASSGSLQSKLHVIELGAPPGQTGFKKQAELFFPPEFENDFPVALNASAKHALVFVTTKLGLVFVYDLPTGTAVYRTRFSTDAVFLTCDVPGVGGVYAVNRRGQLLLLSVNEDTIVPYISGQLQNTEVALALASRAGLPGADSLIVQEFERLMGVGNYREAAEMAARSPRGILRTDQVMARFKSVQVQPGQASPLLQYFGILLQQGALNERESVELAGLVLAQNKKHLLVNWFNENKLTSSEQLGDMLAQAGDQDLALKMYQKGNVASKAVTLLAAKGDFESLMAYTGQTGVKPDYMYLLQALMKDNPEGALNLAKGLAKQSPPPVEPATVAELFLQRNMIREATAFLLEALSEDREEDAVLQTKVIEINLITNPQVADAILSSERFSFYDRPRVAQQCERAGLYMRALQHYTELPDIKRCVVNTHAMQPEELVEYFGTLSTDWALDCCRELLSSNVQQNLQVVVLICKEYREQLGVDPILAMFDKFRPHGYAGVYHFLAAEIATTTEPDITFRYIEAAAKTQQYKEVERITRESDHYDPKKVKTFLMEAKLPDMRPLINVCDRHDMVYDMAKYLYTNNHVRYIEGFCQKVNPQKTHEVAAALLDSDAESELVNSLVVSVRSLLKVEPLVAVFEERYKLKQLLPFLEHLVNEGSTDVHVHNALGKIMIETNNNPEHFISTNPYYDPLVVGKFAEKRDPHLACEAYKKGQCDDALLACTNKNSLFKVQARYVVGRKDGELWGKVLDDENQHRRSLIDQVVAHALPECKDPEEVSAAVKAFMAQELQAELIELLEKIVLNNSSFSANPNLQNLLIITAIKSDPSRVMDYVNRLDNFDGPAVAEVAIEYELFEEGCAIYKKFRLHVDAVRVMVDHLKDLERALEYTTKVDEPAVWSVMAAAQLAAGQPAAAIDSYLRANDASDFVAVIRAAKEHDEYAPLVKYLLMVRKQVKEAEVDNELMFAYAKTENLVALEELLSAPNMADVEHVGDMCFEAKMYPAAKVVFKHIPHWGKLASTLVRMQEFGQAVDAARKANSIRTWKEVCYACVEFGEFKLAQLCGLNIIVNADEMDELSQFYQERDHIDQLLDLFEAGIGSDRAHMGIFTELGALYARYRPERLMEHLKLFSDRINIPRLIRVCDQYAQWAALTFLYVKYEEYDNALNVVMEHSPDAWEHVLFKDIAAKVSSIDLYYKAVHFYLDEHPDLLNDAMRVLEQRIDHAKVVGILRQRGQLPLIKPYLLHVQPANLAAVNEAVNGLLVEEEDHEALAESIASFDNYDQARLAAELERHALLEFRKIAAQIYRKVQKWRAAIELLKKDQMWRDAMEYASESQDKEIVEEMLRFFIDQGLKECFAACLFTCYDLVPPDVAMELAWLHGLSDVVMPFMVQSFRDLHGKVDVLMADRRERLAREKEREGDETEKEAQEMMAAMKASQTLALPAPAQLVSQGPGIPDGQQNYLMPGYNANPMLMAPGQQFQG
ncbi:unnamed protein product [Pedinophyceae sp. YPF-701]|nr:unnamed protein product [Pedinophyceae sp. YPF-701]